jgi:spore maturation protein CgeB
MRKLRIFYASDTTPNAWFKSVRSNIWRNNLLLPLRDLGHDVVEFDYDLTQTFRYLNPAIPQHAEFIAKNRPVISEALLTQLLAAHRAKPIDVLFTYYTDACLDPAVIAEIRAMGIVTVNWYCNGSYLLHLVTEISKACDFVLVPEKFRMDDYLALGARPIYCQEAANPNIYQPRDIPQDFDVSFAGQAYGDRPALVQFLLGQQINMHAFGMNWQPPSHRFEERKAVEFIPAEHRHDVLSDDDLIALYSRSKINLGFSTCGETHVDPTGKRIVQIRLRDFEIPMAGGFYMVEHQDELAEFFDLQNEIVCYHSREDLVDKIRHYLAHPEQRNKIRLAGMARARRDHTWQKRFTDAFSQMGLT